MIGQQATSYLNSFTIFQVWDNLILTRSGTSSSKKDSLSPKYPCKGTPKPPNV